MESIIIFLASILILFNLSCKESEKEIQNDSIIKDDYHYYSQKSKENHIVKKTSIIYIPNPVKNFGNIEFGNQVLKHEYEFFNVGNEPLIIKDVKGSGGFMYSTFPKRPIPIGGKGVIKTSISTKGMKYAIHKRWVINANTIPNQTFIHIKANLGYCSNKIDPISNSAKLTEICIPETVHDLGKITSQYILDTFEIQNTGIESLMINNVRGSGGPAKWPSKPIPVNTRDHIIVNYGQALHKKGKIHKTWTIDTNTFPRKSRIILRAEIIAPE